MTCTHASLSEAHGAIGIPSTGRQRCGRFGGAGRLTWCRPCAQLCARQAGGLCL